MAAVGVIHSWSTPRSLSTSLMYSFAQRDDMEVVDEPFYGNFLRETGIERPYRKELLSRTEPDVNKLVKDVIFGPGKKKYRYCKQIAYECPPGILSGLLKKGKHFILIRNPHHILVVLRGLCEDLEIPFQASMLRWEAGPKEYDGVWAPWWYRSVHKSTCFSKPRKYPPTFPFELYDLLEQSMPFYHMLKSKVRKRTSVPPSKQLLPNEIQSVTSNERTLIWVDGELVPCGIAKVPVFDCVLQGDHVGLEGLCAYNGKVFKLNEHLERILHSAKALAANQIPSKEVIKEAIFNTLISNGMLNSACIKLALICCKKVTYGKCPSHDDLYKCTLIVLVHRKGPFCDHSAGMKLITRAPVHNKSFHLEDDVGDSREALIIDKDGFLSRIHATNIFMVKKEKIFTTPIIKCGLPSISYTTVIELINKEKLKLYEQKISMSEFQTADEVWTTGTMGEMTPIIMIDSCVIGNGEVGPVTKSVLDAYKDLIEESGATIPVNHDEIQHSP